MANQVKVFLLKGLYNCFFAGYPDFFDNNQHCVKILKAPAGFNVALEFLDIDFKTGCNVDSVEVYDGMNFVKKI